MKIAVSPGTNTDMKQPANKKHIMSGDVLHRLLWRIYKYIILVIAVLVVLSRIMPHSHDGWWNGEYNTVSSDWTCIRADGTSAKVTLPHFINVPAGEKIVLERKLPERITDGSTLFIYCMRQDMVAYIDGQRVATYKGSASDMPYKWYTVQCTSDDGGKLLKICYQSKYDGFAGCFNNIYLGERSTIIYHLAVKNAFPLAAGLLVCIAGLVVLVYYNLFLRKNTERRFLYMGSYMLVMGIWLIMECRINQTFLSNLAYAQTIDYIGLPMLIVPVLLYVDEIEEKAFHRSAVILAAAGVIFLYICLIGSAAGWLELCNVVSLAHIFIALCVIYILITMVILLRRGEKRYDKIKWNFYGMTSLCLGTGLDMYGYYFRRNAANDGGIALGITIYCIFNFCQFLQYQKDKQLEEAEAFRQNSDRTQFLADMSHAIRTPANAVLGMDDMILRESDSERITEYATDIKSAGDTLLSSIDDILDFSNIEAGRTVLKKEEYSVASLLNDCYSMINIRAEAKGLIFTVDNDPDMPAGLCGDVSRLRQIIINLLTNAVKYTSKGNVNLSVGMVEIDEENSIILQIEVMDTGIGISREGQNKLFSPYARLDESRNREIEGTGLGLSLTKRLVDLMGGDIFVESIYGAGSKFTVRVKQTISDPTPSGSFADWAKHRDEKARMVKWFYAPDVRILVVDDVSMNIKVMQGLLGETGVAMDTAYSGAECLRLTAEKKYDMIFMDDMMPEMSGTETYIKMKNDSRDRNADTPVIMLTANAVMGARENYLNTGFAGYLSKPIIESELRDIMEKYLPEELVLQPDEDQDGGQEEQEDEDETCSDIVRSVSGYLDTEEGIGYCMDSADMYTDILKDYADSSRRQLIIDAYDREDWKEYRVNVHALKSTSRTIGADSLSEKALKLEEAARDLNTEYIRANHAEMLAEYEELLGKLKVLFEKNTE
jgi:signal transduction histidine kinase/CheY-like chemotaxis protein/HPt (histidine-containing phosphotransfer) domain-containing protein